MSLRVFTTGSNVVDECQQFVVLMLALFCSVVFLILTGAVIAHFVYYSPTTHEELLRPFQLDLVGSYLDYGPHPKQHLIFIILCLLSPVYCLVSILVSQKVYFYCKSLLVKSYIARFGKLLVFILVTIFLGLMIYYFYRSYYGGKILVFILHNPKIILWLVFILVLEVLLVMLLNSNLLFFMSKKWKILIKTLLFGVGICAILFHAFALRLVNFNVLTHLTDWQKNNVTLYDLETVYYAIVQVFYGKTLLSNLTSIYGLFPEILYPIFKIIGLSLFKFSLIMEILEGLILAVFLWVIYKLTRNVWLSCLFILCICFVEGGTFLWIIEHTFVSPYYQYWPIRVVFPTLSLFLFLRFANRMSVQSIVVMAVVTAAAFFWNFESSIPIFGATIVYLLCLTVFPVFQEKKLYLRLIVSYCIVIFICLFLLALYLEVKSDFTIQWNKLFKYPIIFYKQGYSQIPLPMPIHLWTFVLLTYLIGITYTFYQWWHKKKSVLVSCIFYLSVLGIGLFTYYEYRAHIFNLIAVSWPAILLGCIFSNIVLEKVRQKKLSLITTLFIFPFIYCLLLVVSIYLYSTPYLYKNSVMRWSAMQKPNDTSKLMRDYLFIKQKVKNSQDVVILIQGQGVLFDKLGMASAIDGPSMTESLLKTDYDNVTKLLLAKPVAHVFVDRDSKRLPVLFLKYINQGITVDGTMHLVPKHE